MVQKHIIISMIAPVALAGILILAISAATVNAQESNSTGNGQQSSGTENATSTGVTGYCPPTCAPPPAEPAKGTNSNTNSTPVVPENTPSSSGPTASNNSGIAQADLANIILTVHNRERAVYGVSQLVWSDKLAADAKTWADHLASDDECCHHDSNLKGEGENIAWGGSARMTDVAALISQLQDGWVSEKSGYHGAGPPTNYDAAIGHWWEMVTPKATEVGCGTSANGHILVCRYGGDFSG